MCSWMAGCAKLSLIDCRPSNAGVLDFVVLTDNMLPHCPPGASSHSRQQIGALVTSYYLISLQRRLLTMGVEPPFIYDPPSRYSFSGPSDKAFNPKAATQASWSSPVPKPKPDGPLINFNRHPDSVGVHHRLCLLRH